MLEAEHAETEKQRTEQDPLAVARRPAQRPRSEFVRRSLDLSPAHHDALTMWCAETAPEVGRARLTGSDVLRALVKRLLTDEAFAGSIRRQLREDYG